METLFKELQYALGDRCCAIKITMVEKTTAVIRGCEISDDGEFFLCDDEIVVEREELLQVELNSFILTENGDFTL